MESSLVIGFFGDGETHKDNARALLADLIGTYTRDNKRAKIRFVLPVDNFTTTMRDLADYALTSGYKIGLVGHDKGFEDPEVMKFYADAAGSIQRIQHSSLAKGVVDFIGAWKVVADVKLIMVVPNPEEDEYAQIALSEALGKNIPVRSLLHGLDVLDFKSEEKPNEEEQTDMAPRSVEDEDFEEETEDEDLEDDEDFEEGEDDEPDEEDLEADEEDEEESDVDDVDEESDDDIEEDEGESDEEDDDSEEDLEDEEVDDEEEDLDDDDVEGDDDDEDVEEEEEEPVPPVRSKKKAATTSSSGNTPITAAALTRLANNDREAFYRLAKRHKHEGRPILPGRGMKTSMMIDRILISVGKAPAPKTAALAKRAAKKASAAKKAAPRRAEASSAPVRRTAIKKASTRAVAAPTRAAAASNGLLTKADLRRLAKSTRELAEVLEKALS